MNLSPLLLKHLMDRHDWFTITKVTVRMSDAAGGYLMDIAGDYEDTIAGFTKSGILKSIESVSGIAHDPERHWRFAFRIDSEGAKLAANAPGPVKEAVSPLLAEALAS